MKRAITIWALQGGMDGSRLLVDAATAVRDAGFDGVEASLHEAGDLSLASSPADLGGLRAQLDKHRGIVSSVSTLLFERISLTAPGADERAQARRVAFTLLEAADALGAATVSLSPGRVTPEVDDLTAYARSLEQMAAIGQRARELGVRVGVENVWHGMLTSPLEFASFLDEVGEDHVGACLDLGNATKNGHPQHWAAVLGTRIVKVHVTDTRRLRANFLRFCDPGAGDVDWYATMRALARVGYEGWATVEAFGEERSPERDYLGRLCRALDGVLEKGGVGGGRSP
jgi:hexulose-6-phosphate isomerase